MNETKSVGTKKTKVQITTRFSLESLVDDRNIEILTVGPRNNKEKRRWRILYVALY